MKIPIVYNLRSLAGRPVSTAFTALGIGLVVAVFIAMLALANGFATALTKTGSDRNVLVLRKGADNEMSSGIDRASVSIVAASPHVAHGPDGAPLVSPEVYVVLPRGRIQDTTQNANVVLRGISEKAWEVRSNIQILDGGRRPAPGQNEVCVGSKLVNGFPHTAVGDDMEIAGRPWKVVCHFSAGGSSFESEIWGMNEQVMPVMRGEVFQSVTFRLNDPAAFDEAKRTIEADQRLTVDVQRESTFYSKQSAVLGLILKILAVMITSIMAVGAVFGAINTMFAAVASRSSEIAVLLTLGFRPRSILASFLAESALLALVGGIIGCLIALPVNGVVANTTNWASFSEIAFAFRITPGLLLWGLIFSLVMGLIGGLLPAWRAAKMEVVKAIR
jgi:ABC-type lipoprotein release transport system permease subunit